MKFLAVWLFTLGICPAIGEMIVLGIDGRPARTSEYAVVAADPIALRLLLPANFTTAAFHGELYQIAGRVAQPLPCEISVGPSPDDSRIGIVRLTPPAVERITRITLRLRDLGAIDLIVYPASQTRSDLPLLRDVFKASRLQLSVCGRSPELRAFLKSHGLEFEDHGNEAPTSIPSETLLLGVLKPEEWTRLAAVPATSGLLAFVGNDDLLPGVYSQSRATKITLPLLPALPTDPRACETLFHLILSVLTSKNR